MKPLPNIGAAVHWEFRRHGDLVGEKHWDWRCKSDDGHVIAKSSGIFSSLRKAIADANRHGFRYEHRQPARLDR